MKCLILAGGSGNRLWPLSRTNYPKQFINIENNHSLLQEAVARNMPFCDEFIISTNIKYNFIVEGQMQVFQGLKYRCIYEESPLKTAGVMAVTSMLLNPSELLLTVTADHIIKGWGYSEAVLRGKSLAQEGHLAAFGLEMKSAHTGYGYLRPDKDCAGKCIHFHEKPEQTIAEKYYTSREYLWNSGIYLFSCGDFLNELSECMPELFKAARSLIKAQRVSKREIILSKEQLRSVPVLNVEKALFEKTDNLYVVPAYFSWKDISELESLNEYRGSIGSKGVLQNESSNTEVINQNDNHLIVTNGLKDLIIVNTPDATYISKINQTFHIKDIIKNHYGEYARFFDENVLSYRSWGTYEVLKAQENYKVKKVLIYPGKSLRLHKHKYRSEHWAIVHGTASITLEKETREYKKNDFVFVPAGMVHRVANHTNENLIIIETAVGETVVESDTESYTFTDNILEKSELVKLKPIFKDYIWGGTKLRTVYNKDCNYAVIAESWELSAHPSGESMIAEGKYAGFSLRDYLCRIDPNSLGWKAKAYKEFPLLVKFIDAKQALSVQVHPDDDYALCVENEYGKNEMWYVADCEKDSYLYYGFNKDVTKQEIGSAVKNKTLLGLLNCIPVKKGDVFFVEAGTVHAIGGGVLICEIQQSSNSTYRLYDYGRKDKYGKERELHLDKALDVVNTNKTKVPVQCKRERHVYETYETEELGKCKYFESVKYLVHGYVSINVDSTSFVSMIVLEGDGTVCGKDEKSKKDFASGDSFFIPADFGSFEVRGNCEFIITHI